MLNHGGGTAAHSRALGAVVAVNELLGVDTDAQRFGDRLLFGFAATELARCSACQHSQYRLTRSLSGDGNAKTCCQRGPTETGLNRRGAGTAHKTH
jgi:hypothetical protein